MASTLGASRIYRFAGILDVWISGLIWTRHADWEAAGVHSISGSPCWIIRAVFGVVLSAALVVGVVKAQAENISFELASNSLIAPSGGTALFLGTVTNDSGSDLHATDFFFNFFGFDATSVTPSQDLGVATDFLIPNGSTSATVDLFSVQLGSVPAGSGFPIQVQLEDINSDLSAIQSVHVNTVPEPSSLVLFGIGTLGLLAEAWRTNTAWKAERMLKEPV